MTTLFTTRTQAIDFLVAQGKPLAHAKVAVNEAFNYDQDGDTRDLIVHNFNFDNDAMQPVATSEEDVLQTYEDMMRSDGYFTLKNGGFYFGEDELMYDLNGDQIAY